MATISTTEQDGEGISLLTSNDMLHAQYVDISTTSFGSPDALYSGFAQDGYNYTLGVLNSPAQLSSWSIEGQHSSATDTRGLRDKFPTRSFVITTPLEVVILNADDLTVWMRFTLGAASSPTFLGNSSTTLKKALFVNGVLIVTTSGGIRVASFALDYGYAIDGSLCIKSSKNISQRNNVDFFTTSATATDITSLHTSQKTILPGGIMSMDAKYLYGAIFVVTGHPSGFSAVDVTNLEKADAVPKSKNNTFSTDIVADGFWSIAGTGKLFVENTPNSSPTDWGALGVKSGDTLVVDLGSGDTLVPISSVQENTAGQGLLLGNSVPLYSSSVDSNKNYSIQRKVSAIAIFATGELIYANGDLSVALSVSSWRDFTQAAVDGFTVSQNFSSISGGEGITTLVSDSDDVFIGTTKGLYRTTKDFLGAEIAAEFWYGPTADSLYSSVISMYTLSSTSISAIAKDSESGHLYFAFDVDPSVPNHNGEAKALLFGVATGSQRLSSDDIPMYSASTIKTIAGFRNNNGPPNKAI